MTTSRVPFHGRCRDFARAAGRHLAIHLVSISRENFARKPSAADGLNARPLRPKDGRGPDPHGGVSDKCRFWLWSRTRGPGGSPNVKFLAYGPGYPTLSGTGGREVTTTIRRLTGGSRSQLRKNNPARCEFDIKEWRFGWGAMQRAKIEALEPLREVGQRGTISRGRRSVQRGNALWPTFGGISCIAMCSGSGPHLSRHGSKAGSRDLCWSRRAPDYLPFSASGMRSLMAGAVRIRGPTKKN